MSVNPGTALHLVILTRQEALYRDTAALLEQWPGEVRVTWIADPDQALARLPGMEQPVTLIDDGLVGEQTPALIRELAAQAPRALLVALVDEQAVGSVRAAILAGARSFLTKPLDAAELIGGLGQLLTVTPPASPPVVHPAPAPAVHAPVHPAPALPKQPGHVVVFCGPKGGTGRTTMMVNTSVALHQQSRRPVALVDADFSAPALDVALNLRDERDLADLTPRLAKLDDELLDRVLAHHASGVRVLLAPPPDEHDHRIGPEAMLTVIEHLRRHYAWVVVDLGLPVDDTALALFDVADRVLVSVLPEMVGLRNTRLLLELLQRRNYGPEKVWLVLNRATLRGGVSRQDIQERLHMPVHHAIPDDQPLASLSVNRGVPLVLSHPKSAVARAVQGLAGSLIQALGLAPGPAPQPAPSAGRAPLRAKLLGWLGRTPDRH